LKIIPKTMGINTKATADSTDTAKNGNHGDSEAAVHHQDRSISAR
jgi:hypothetical protein